MFFVCFFNLDFFISGRGSLLTQCIFFQTVVKYGRQFFSQKFPAPLLLSLHELNLSEKRKRGEEGRGGDNKRNNFNTISFLLFYKEKTVLNLCIYMYIQQILHQYISYFFFKNLHIIIASYQIVYNPSWLKLAFLEKIREKTTNKRDIYQRQTSSVYWLSSLVSSVRVRVFNATFNNISVVSWRSVLFVSEWEINIIFKSTIL